MSKKSEFDKWFSKGGAIVPTNVNDAGFVGYISQRTAWLACLKRTKKHYQFYAPNTWDNLLSIWFDEQIELMERK